MPYYSDFKDVSSDPECFGLVQVAEAERSEPCYSFDTIVVWYREEDNKYYWAQDSGCSCPSPFEDFGCRMSGDETLDSVEIQEVLDKMESGDVLRAIRALVDSADDSYDRAYAAREMNHALGELIEFQKGLK